MKLTKRALPLILCCVMILVCVFSLNACKSDCEHEWGEYSVTTAATCLAEGTETRTCNKCDETEDRAIAKTVHSFTSYTSDGNATCLADGTKTATCNTAGCNATDTVADVNSKTSHSFTNYTSNGDATCSTDGTKTAVCDTEGCSASETVTDTDSKKPHSFTNYVSNGDATCSADGTKTAVCDYVGCIETNTVTDEGSKTDHKFTIYTSNGDATCVLDGTKTAVCDFEDCNEEDTIEDEGSKLGHDWNLEKVTCEDGRYCERSGCDAQEAALGHSYVVVGGTQLTCETNSTTVYECSNGCGDSFTVTNELAKGHNVTKWDYIGETLGTEKCNYVQSYTGVCENPGCGETVNKTETVVRHSLTSSIKTPANCKNEGTKLLTCTECGHTEEEKYSNVDAHVWGDGVTEGNITTYTCTVCGGTKTTINASTEKETTVDKSTLESAGEVELKDASIALDSGTLGGLEGDVNISAGTLEGDELAETQEKLSDEQLAQIGNNPIYNFGMSDSNGVVENFNGTVTVRVPYTLADGEDVDSIAVWFINENGEVESIKATYDNGYAVFTTTHFSYYTVTRLTPAERCALYGHAHKEVTVPATCITDGYIIKICQRCGDSSKEITEKADGHNLSTSTIPATCTASGTATHSCSDCDYERVEKLAPLGHSWSVSDEVAATCKSAGYVIYSCGNTGCNETYKTVLAQKSHTYVDTVTPATCTTGGYTTRVCKDCENTVVTNKIDALGHNYKTEIVAPGCTAEGYTLHDCTRCDHSYKTDLVPARHTWDIEVPTCGKGQICTVCGIGGQSATGNHTMQNGICTVCGAGCSHSFNGVVTAPTCTEQGYTTNTCTSCGIVEIVDYTPATGHKGTTVCEICGESAIADSYYTNILSSLLSENYTIVIDKLVVEDVAISNSEINLSIKDGGKLAGYGTLNVEMYGTVATFKAVIEDDVLYLEGKNTMSLMGINNMNIKLPFDALITIISEEASNSMASILSLAANAEVLSWVTDTLLPFVQNATAGGKETANLIAEKVVNLIADVTLAEDGNMVISLSTTKLKALNARLATETVGDFIDAEFGIGTYDDVVDAIGELFTTTLGEIIDGAKANGADVIELVNSVDALMSSIVGQEVTLSDMMGLEPDGTTPAIQAMLASEELRALTIEDIVTMLVEGMGGDVVEHGHYDEDANGICDECGSSVINPTPNETVPTNKIEARSGSVASDESEEETESIRASVIEMLTMVKSMTVYQLCNVEDEERDNVQAYIDDMIDSIFAEVSFSATTDKNGTVQSINFVYDEYAKISVVLDHVSTNNYAEVKENVESNAILTPTTDSLTGKYTDEHESYTYEFVTDENGISSIILVGSEFDNYRSETGESTDEEGNVVKVEIRYGWKEEFTRTFDLSGGYMILSHKDCGDVIIMSVAAPYTYTYTSSEIIERYVNGELVESMPVGNSYSGEGSGFNWYTFAYDTKTNAIISIPSDADPDYTLHNYEINEGASKPAEGCDGVGEMHFFCTECGETVVQYYTNGHQHTASRAELIGDATNCEDGVIVTYYCLDCGEVLDEYESYYHESTYEYIDLSEYGSCDKHRIQHTFCACGEHDNTYFEGIDYVYDGDVLAKCDDCGLVINYNENRIPGENCSVTYERTYVVLINGKTVYTLNTSSTSYSHNYFEEITLMPGATSCEDGIYITNKCVNCGMTTDTWEEYYHHGYRKIIADFSMYGSTCGGYIYNYGCACGHYEEKDAYVEGNCEFEQTEEYWNDWCDYIYKFTCAVTSPACGFTYYDRMYYTESECGRVIYHEYYVLDDNGGKIVLYSAIEHDETWHNWETASETTTPTNFNECLYYVVRDEQCSVCGITRNYTGYDFIHNELVNDESGEHCNSCGYGNVYELDDEGRLISEHCTYYYIYNNNRIEKSITEYNYIYNKGYQFETRYYYSYTYYDLRDGKWILSNEDWSEIVKEYNFDSTCSVTVIYNDKNGSKETTDNACYYCSNVTITNPTCTQDGSYMRICYVCGTENGPYTEYPIQHEWWWYDAESCHICVLCGLKNANGASGEIILEDASDLDDDEDTYIVGYFYRYGEYEVIQSITLILEDGSEIYVDGIEIVPYGNGRYLSFSKSAVIEAAKAMGYTEDQFDIRISFVPVEGKEDLDYAITFEVRSANAVCKHFYYEGVCVLCDVKEGQGGITVENTLYTYTFTEELTDNAGNAVGNAYYFFYFVKDGTVTYYAYAELNDAGEVEPITVYGKWESTENGVTITELDGSEENLSFVFDENGNLMMMA